MGSAVKFAHSLILLVFAALPGLAAESHPVTLWQIDGKHNVVFLLGSIHMLRADDHPLPAVVEAAYDEAEALVMELDMDDLDPAATQAAFNRAGMLADGRTLADLMGETAYAEAARLADAVDIPLDMLGQTKPWLAAMTVEMMLLFRIGFDPSLGIDMTMAARAQSDGKPISGLETVDDQLSFLDGLPLEAQRAMLLETLRDGADIENSIDAMITAWRNGDVETLESGLTEAFDDHEALSRMLIEARNRRWVEAIVGLLDDDEDYLVVVGALHLVGDLGVPGLLETRGTHIRQLSEPE